MARERYLIISQMNLNIFVRSELKKTVERLVLSDCMSNTKTIISMIFWNQISLMEVRTGSEILHIIMESKATCHNSALFADSRTLVFNALELMKTNEKLAIRITKKETNQSLSFLVSILDRNDNLA